MPKILCGHLIKRDPERPCALARGHKSKAHRDRAALTRHAENIKAKYAADPQKYRDIAASRRKASPDATVWVGSPYKAVLRELAAEDSVPLTECLRRLIERERDLRVRCRGRHAQ
jgi:hypothetical protein